MGHLVRDLKGNSEITLLPEIYKIIAKHLLIHRSSSSTKVDFDSVSFDEICKVVHDTESMVPLAAAQAEADALLEINAIGGDPLIDKPYEQPGEMFNNLGQLEVLAKTVEYFKKQPDYSFTVCAPTQVTVHTPSNSSFHRSGNLRHLVHDWDVRDSSGIA